MSQQLVFHMGEFEAEFPTDRRYAKNHMWACEENDQLLRFGFTAYAVRLLQDVYFLEWFIDEGTVIEEKQELGTIESKKAESSLYAPVAGRLVRFNEGLLEDPSAINVDKYGNGWLFEVANPDGGLLGPDDYVEHLEAVWEVTQRTIKGQLN